jgi:pyrroline-5-carboxylate reductase
MTLVCFGGGNMGVALVDGWLSANAVSPNNIVIVEPVHDRRAQLTRLTNIGVTVAAQAPDVFSDVVVAVKPNHVTGVLEVARRAGARRVLSIAAGVPLSVLTQYAGADAAVVRSMPNTPALVHQAMSALSTASSTSDADRQWAQSLLDAVGKTIWLAESLMDVYTAVIGSGPAYVLLLAEALADAGRRSGLPEETAQVLTRQLLVGVGALLSHSPQTLAALRESVTSPGGTTAAGLSQLVDGGFAEIVAGAVQAATERSIQLGQSS